MKTILNYVGLLAFLSVVAYSCQKEISFESGDQSTSSGSLQANGTGGCLGSVVSGTYKKDTTLTTAHYVDVNVQVDTIGTYAIATDTVNGYSFKATGTFTSTGVQVVRLAGSGKPLAAGTNVFTVRYDGTTCDFSVTVTAAPGGGGTAAFSVNCTGTVVSGTYQAGTPVAGATAVVNVNVTSLGTWSITTAAVNGITFSGSGTFTTLGAQTVTLNGSGTPAASGTFNIAIVVNATTCTFPVTVTAIPPPPTNDYFPRTANSNWSYELDNVSTDSVLVRATAATHTVAGNVYTIFEETDDASFGWDSSGYYRKSGGNYHEWIDMGSAVGLDDELWMDYIFLKDDQAAGHQWLVPFSGTFMGFPIQARFQYTILQKDVPAVSNGVTYQNTIVVEERLFQFDPGTNTWVDLTTQPDGISLKYYYSRNVGLIKIEVMELGVTLAGEFEMRRYAVY